MIGRSKPFFAEGDGSLKRKRFVDILDTTTNVATYPADDTAMFITVGDSLPEYNNTISIVSTKDLTQEFMLELGATVTFGQGVMPNTDGLGIPVTVETPVVYAMAAGVAGDTIPVRSYQLYI